MTKEREATWTLEELAARVALALSVDYDGQPSGRVREVPDGRVVRYYTTLGLVDRPLRYEGRVAVYGPRHLLQIVAIKRLQTKGLSLSEIQQQFLRLEERELARLAAVPADALLRAGAPQQAGTGGQETGARDERSKEEEPARPEKFWNAAPAEAVTEPIWKGARPAATGTVTGVSLSPETLLLAAFVRVPEEADVEALRAAAAPLLKVLEKRGLI